MKKNLLLSACLLLTGGLFAQTPEAESPVFRLDGFDASTVSAFSHTPKEGSEDLIPWTQPDTIVQIKATPVGACSKAGEGDIYGIYVYNFDDRGNMIAQEALQYISADVWLPQQRIVSSYNQWDLVDTTTSYYYNAKDGIFVPNACKISTYNKRAQRTQLLNLSWNSQTDTWAKASRFTYTYDKNNRLVSSLQEEPDDRVVGREAWKKVWKTDYGYDRKDSLIRLEIAFWTGMEWFPYRSVYYTYDNDFLAKELGYLFNELTGIYGPSYRYEYTYNEWGKMSNILLLNTDTLGVWDTTAAETIFFDEQGRDTGNLVMRKDGGFGYMVGHTREFYYYNEDGVKDSVVHEEWEADGGWWHTISLSYAYNEQGIRSGYTYYNLTQESFATDKYEWEFNEYGDGTRSRVFTIENGSWVAADRWALEVTDRYGNEIMRANSVPLHEITVHYTSGTKTPAPEPDTTADDSSAIERLYLPLDAQVDVYPNPAVETLYVDIDGEGVYEVALVDMAGVAVEAFRMESGRKALDVSGYKGIYMLRVSKAGAAAVRKIMIL